MSQMGLFRCGQAFVETVVEGRSMEMIKKWCDGRFPRRHRVGDADSRGVGRARPGASRSTRSCSSGSWCCSRWTICRTSRSRTRSATAGRSRALSGLASRTHAGCHHIWCFARRWPRRRLIASCLSGSASISRPRATLRGAASSLTPRLFRCPGSARVGGERADQGRRDAQGLEEAPAKNRRRTRTRAGRRRTASFYGYKNHLMVCPAQADPRIQG